MKVMFKTLVTRSILGLALLTATQSTCFGASKTIVTGLHAAIAAGNLALVKKLADKCPAVLNTPGEDGRTALHYACMNDNEAIVDELLRRGANPTIKDIFGRRPQRYAITMETATLMRTACTKYFDDIKHTIS